MHSATIKSTDVFKKKKKKKKKKEEEEEEEEEEGLTVTRN
jgi:hypothetical protein